MLDASALLAYLRGEPGADTVRNLLVDRTQDCVVHAMNLCEVYYQTIRSSDESHAVSALEDLKELGLIVRDDFDEEFWLTVGKHKAPERSVPLADFCAAELANRINAEVITADHADFGRIKERGICRVRFIRPKRQTPDSAS